jgi:rod shape determining protein RodA
MTPATFSKALGEFDYCALSTIAIISSIGFCVLYSAAGGHFDPWANKQILRFSLGVALLLATAFTDIRVWRSLSYALYSISLLLLIFVEFKGHIGMGAQRWIDLYIFHLQPSELMKITLVMALANYFHMLSPDDISKVKTYFIPLLMIAVPSLLVLRQPNLGTMLIFVTSGAAVLFAAGIRYWKILTAFVCALASLPILWSQMHTYQKNRVLTFLNPQTDPLGTGYNLMQSKIAIGSGGFWGKGFLQGSQGRLNFLPEKQTDFIFAMFCEEFGAAGGLLLIALYSILVLYGYRVSLESKNFYGRLFGIGFITLFFLYIFVNIAMVMGLLPVAGVPLPFMSYGGTSMLSLMIGFGLLLSVSRCRSLRFGRNC